VTRLREDAELLGKLYALGWNGGSTISCDLAELLDVVEAHQNGQTGGRISPEPPDAVAFAAEIVGAIGGLPPESNKTGDCQGFHEKGCPHWESISPSAHQAVASEATACLWCLRQEGDHPVVGCPGYSAPPWGPANKTGGCTCQILPGGRKERIHDPACPVHNKTRADVPGQRRDD
jgi:hypothetical protein